MQVGNYSIPDSPNRLPDLLDPLRKIYDVYTRNDIKDVLKNDGLAKLLNYKSSNNGSFQRKIRGFREYGLLEGKGDLKVSARGESILYGTESERSRALQDAFMAIPLWNKLFKRFGKNLPMRDFWLHLKETTGCSPKDAQDLENTVRDAYTKDASVVSDINSKKGEMGETYDYHEKEQTTPLQESLTVQFRDDGELALTLLYRLEAYEIAGELIQFLKEKKQDKKNTEKES